MTPPDDVMSTAAAGLRLLTLSRVFLDVAMGTWRGDPATLPAMKAEADALTSVIVLHTRAEAAWLAGAEATRAADVAEVRRIAGEHSAAVRWYCAETTAAAPDWSERADYESRASATLQGAGDALAALPLPPPPQTAPAPPQSPLPSPDGGTGPQGDGAPAGGCGVAAEALVGRWRRAALDAVAQRIREHRDAFVGQRGADYTSEDYVAGINDCLRIILSNPREGGS